MPYLLLLISLLLLSGCDKTPVDPFDTSGHTGQEHLTHNTLDHTLFFDRQPNFQSATLDLNSQP